MPIFCALYLGKHMRHAIYFALVVAASNVFAQTTYYTDRYGQPAGTTTTMGNVTFYTNQYGQPMGTASTYGNTTTYANPNGQVIGGVPQPPPPSYPTSNAIGGANNLPYPQQYRGQ